jgi:hypothetical protein
VRFRTGVAVLALVSVLLGAASSQAAGARSTAAHRILFGLGTEANGDRTGTLAKSAPLGMLSSWYNGPSDLSWMSGWETSEVPRDYAAGYDMHLIVWSGEARTTFSTPFGTACGKAYPVSQEFLADIERLARIFRPADGRTLYVTLFTELQTYACNGNEWSGSPQTTAYYEALKSQYTAAMGIFHRLAPGSKVSLGWGGWQARWNGPATGAGKSLFKHFAGVMHASDFESFQMLGSATDTTDILAMTQQLKRYGPVMLAYYRPPEGGVSVTREHLKSVLAPAFLEKLTRLRLFSMAFVSEEWFAGDPTSLGLVQDAIKGFGCRPCATPARVAGATRSGRGSAARSTLASNARPRKTSLG